MPQRFGFTTPQAAPIDPLVAALLRGGQGPSRTNLEGLGRLAQTLSGALRERQLDVQGRQEQAEALSALLSSGGETVIPPEENIAAGPGSDIAAGFGVPTVESGPLQGPGFDIARDVISDQPRDLSQGVLGRIFGLGNAPSKAQLSLAEALINRGFANQDAQAQFGRQKALFDARTEAQLAAKQQPLTPEQFAQQRALRSAGRAVTNINNTVGNKSVDKEVAKTVVEAKTGGLADAEKNITQIEEAIGALESGRDLTGGVIGRLPKGIRSLFNAESVNVQEIVEEVVQRNLRQVLGAQFTEKEGTRLIERAFNPALDEKINLSRLKRLAGTMKKALAQKKAAVEFFDKNGTLSGFDGQVEFSADDLIKDAGLDDAPQTSSGPSQEDLEFTARKHGITVEEVKRRLGAQ